MTRFPWEPLPCGCCPDKGTYCKVHRTQIYFEFSALSRYLRCEGKYSDYKRAHDKRLGHHKRRANG